MALSSQTNIAALKAQKATTEFMWGQISMGATVAGTLKKYTGITPTKSELSTVRTCGEHGISDVLADRWGVSWNGTCTDEGDHTDVPVPVFAHGPGSGALEGEFYDNEVVGSTLLTFVG